MNTPDAVMTWVLERDVFLNGDPLRAAALEAGHRVIDWSDTWWSDSLPARLTGAVVFHGSLGNADRIRREISWKPGSYCDTPRFRCSAWYSAAQEWLVHPRWEIHPASRFVAEADAILDRLGATDSVFVRPDSPLKPFSGRVLRRGQISLAALDHGFYYDDAEIPVVVAPVRQISREWRFVVVEGQVIAGSGYIAEGRAAASDDHQGRAWRFAAEIADRLTPPDPVYDLDVCETEPDLRLVELNPFSGADLYACRGAEIVRSVSELAKRAI
jgi:hypothetical protein